VHDIGRAITHKKIIVKHHLEGLLTLDIAKKTSHSEEACERHMKAFNKVRMLHVKKMDVNAIAKTLEMSPFLIKEYLDMQKEEGE
jgi:hypothetical protein